MLENAHNNQGAHALAAGLLPTVEGLVIFEHQGAMDHTVVERLVAVSEEASVVANDPKPVRKRLVNVIVEALENLHRHVAEDDHATMYAKLVATAGRYRLVLGNVASTTTAALLMHRVGILNEMSADELKTHYLGLLGQEGRTERGGAGLGLVTMARRCARPIDLNATSVEAGKSYLVFELSVDRESAPVSP
jgi:hypothetical protein